MRSERLDEESDEEINLQLKNSALHLVLLTLAHIGQGCSFETEPFGSCAKSNNQASLAQLFFEGCTTATLQLYERPQYGVDEILSDSQRTRFLVPRSAGLYQDEAEDAPVSSRHKQAVENWRATGSSRFYYR